MECILRIDTSLRKRRFFSPPLPRPLPSIDHCLQEYAKIFKYRDLMRFRDFHTLRYDIGYGRDMTHGYEIDNYIRFLFAARTTKNFLFISYFSHSVIIKSNSLYYTFNIFSSSYVVSTSKIFQRNFSLRLSLI